MVPPPTGLILSTNIFRAQQWRELTPRQYLSRPSSHDSGSSKNSTIRDGTPAAPGVGADIAIPVVMLLFVICTIMSVLGCAARPTRKKLVNQADAIFEERRLRILSHMTPPVMLKAYHLATETSACVGASKNKRESYEVSEPDNIVEEDDDTCPICLEVILPQQMIRQMPHCSHIFHQSCCEVWIWKTLDRWRYIRLSSPILCPVCRADLEPQQKDVVKKPAPVAFNVTRNTLQQV